MNSLISALECLISQMVTVNTVGHEYHELLPAIVTLVNIFIVYVTSDVLTNRQIDVLTDS